MFSDTTWSVITFMVGFLWGITIIIYYHTFKGGEKMFGKKKEKKDKENMKTFTDGVEQHPEATAVPPSADAPAHEPGQNPAHEPPHQPDAVGPQVIQLPPGVDCAICYDYLFYADNVGVWHNCPRCNPVSMRKQGGPNQVSSKPQKTGPASTEEEKPSKGNLFEFRVCKDCGARNEIHKNKKKWECESCGVSQ